MKLKNLFLLLLALCLLSGGLFLSYTSLTKNGPTSAQSSALSLANKTSKLYNVYKQLSLYTGMPVLPLKIVNSDEINGWTDGQTGVYITTGALKDFQNDDEMATVLAHEMSHVLLKHYLILKPTPDSPLSIVDAEAQADKMGVFLMLRAGYNECNAEGFFQRLQNSYNGDYADPANYDHPSYSYRLYATHMPWCNAHWYNLYNIL